MPAEIPRHRLLIFLFLVLAAFGVAPTAVFSQGQPQGAAPTGSYLPPEYAALAEEGERQMTANKTKHSYTRDLPHARGLNVAITHPDTWTVTPAATPGLPLVLSFIPPGGGFTVELACGSLDLAPEEIVTAEKVAHLLSPEKIKAIQPKHVVVESTHAVRLDGHPALLAVISQPLVLGKEEHVMTSAAYYFISQGNLVMLEGYYSAPDKAQLAVRGRSPEIANMLALFHAMASRIAIWEKEDGGPPPQRIVDQLTQTFTTAGHAKAQDLELRLKYPATWTAKEGDQPHDVQVFSRPGTQDSITLSFLPAGKDAQAQLNDQVDTYDVDKLLPPNVIFEELRNIMLFGRRAGMITYSITPSLGGSPLRQHIRRIIFIEGSTRVQLDCAVATADAFQALRLSDRLAELSPLFLAIVDSIALFSPDMPPLPPVSAQAQAALLPGDTSKTFTTQGHSKAQGTHISLRYPSTWTIREGGTPQVVQTFLSPQPGIYAHLVVGGKEIPNASTLTEERVRSLVDAEVWKKRVPPESTLIEARALTIHGRPACVITQIGVSQEGTQLKKFMLMSFQFVQGGRLNQFSGTVAIPPSDERFFAQRIQEAVPLFRAMVDSIVLHDDDGYVPSLFGTTAAAPPAADTFDLTRPFSTASHTKARGVSLTLKYPGSWIATESGSAEIVQNFTDPVSADSATLFCSPLPLSAGRTPTMEEIRSFMTVEEQKKQIPDSAVIVGHSHLTFNGMPACVLEWTHTWREGGKFSATRNLDFVFIRGTTMITLGCRLRTGQEAETSQLATRMEARRPLFQAIAKTLVVHSVAPAVIPAQRIRPAIPAEAVSPAAAQEAEDRMLAAVRAFEAEGMAAWAPPQGSAIPPGLAVKLQHPKSWLHLPPERPGSGYVQEFRSPTAGFDLGLVLVPTVDFYGRTMTKAEIAAYLTPEKIATFMPDEVEFISARSFQFQGQPACEVHCIQPREKGGVMLTDVVTALFYIRDQTMVNLDGILTTANKAEVPGLLQKLDDLRAPVRAIASTLMLQSTSGSNSGAAPPAAATTTPTAPPPAVAAAPAPAPAPAPATSGTAPASGMKTFSTKDHPKAHGLDFSFQYPASWDAWEPRTSSTIVQTFDHPDFAYSIDLMVTTTRKPEEAPMTEAEAAAELTPAAILRPMGDAITLIRGRQTVFAGKPACHALFSAQTDHLGPGNHLLAIFSFIRHGYMVSFMGTASKIPDADLPRRTQELEAAMEGLAQSLEDHGGAPPPAPPAPPDTRRVFTTTGHPKAAGVRIRLKIPDNWEAQESDDPQIIQRFQSPEKNVWAELFLGEEVPGTAPLTEEEIWHLLKPEELKKQVAGTTTALPATISGMPATQLRFATYAPEVGPQAESRVGTIYQFIQQRRHLQLRLICSAHDKATEKLIGYQDQQVSGNVFYRMAYSLLPDDPAPTADDDATASTTAAISPSLFQGRFLWPLVGVLAAVGLGVSWLAYLRFKSPASAVSRTPNTPLRPTAESQAEAPPPLEETDTPPGLITLLQAGETYGPFPTHQLLELWDSGKIAGNASYRREGMPDYRPLAKDIQHLRTLV